MKFTFQSAPIAKARHRFRFAKGRIMTYDPQSRDNSTAKIEAERQMAYNGLKPLQDVPIMAEALYYTPIPRSFSQGRKNSLERMPCITRPDLDNYLKHSFDILNGIAYGDDRQITRLWAEKVYSHNPRIEISLNQIGAYMINEHAISVKGHIEIEQLTYLVKKANRLGMQRRQINSVYTQDDDEGRHIYFSTESLEPRHEEDLEL